MSRLPSGLIDRLRRLEQNPLAAGRAPERYVIALSGGLDSSVLAHALAASRSEHGRALAAVHIDHGLQPQSADWAEHCRNFCSDLDIDFESRQVQVAAASAGPEAAARDARYAAFEALLRPGDWLLSAHHRDDQAETLLINLLRGGGPLGLAGMPALRPIGRALLARPLLAVTREELEDYARDAGVRWIEDPSNAETAFDRNFIRHELLPQLAGRWPEAGRNLARSARLARDAADLLAELADADLDGIADAAARLDVAALNALERPRRANALRRAVALAGLPTPSAAQLDVIIDEVLSAREDAMPLLAWDGAEIRRFRGRLYLIAAAAVAAFDGQCVSPETPVELGPGLGRLVLRPGPGIDAALARSGLMLRLRQGGEKIKLQGQSHTKKLKKLLQEEPVVPWLRERLPLVYAGERLVAVADLWVAAEAAAEDGYRIDWQGRPALD